ncbi:MAG: hypothetical protein H8E51_03385 [Bacteroidetes bacterium]|nr:hypothetical protein [Bacteroidota bacterium]
MKQILILFLVFFLLGCKKNNPEPPTAPRGTLISYEKVGTLTPDQINELDTEHDMRPLMKYTIDYYSITYTSIYKDNQVLLSLTNSPILLSGLIIVPRSNDSLSLLQYHHGTLLPEDAIPLGMQNAPSNFRGKTPTKTDSFFEVRMLCCVAASHGYIVSAPDYAGLGVSDHVNHPYTMQHELAENSIDMIKATRQFIEQQNLFWKDRLYLTGWSEGAGVCLGTHKAIQEEYSGQFNLQASANYAGPYDYEEFVDVIFDNPNTSFKFLPIYNWASYAMNTSFLNSRPYDQIWRYPVMNPMDAVLVPSTRPVDIYQPFFLQMVQTDSDAGMMNGIQANCTNTGWVPEEPVFFYVGVTDQIIPHQITVNTYQEFKSQGASAKLYEYPGNHFTAVYDYFFQMMEDVDSLNALN